MPVSYECFYHISDYADWLRLDLYDFFMHGDMRALETANRIRRSDIWFFLNGKLIDYVF